MLFRSGDEEKEGMRATTTGTGTTAKGERRRGGTDGEGGLTARGEWREGGNSSENNSEGGER